MDVAKMDWNETSLSPPKWLVSNALGVTANVCDNATYEHRIDDPDGYNFCLVPNEASDGVVFVAIAILLACICRGKFNMLMVLLAGMLLEVIVFYFNTGMFGNSFSLWLGIQPADVFLYVFLPALLLESACRLDFFIFKKLSLQIMTLAFLCVIINVVLMMPIMLFGLNLSASGWYWQHAVLFSVVVASTDAVSVTAVLHAAGAPEALVVLLEGESLFNDATSIVLFEIFFEKVNDLDMGKAEQVNIFAELPSILWQIAWLSFGGIIIGLIFGYLTQAILRYLRRGGLMAKSEISLVLGMAYLCFYIANAPCKVSGVIAVVVMGLQGGSCGKWDMSAKILENGQFDHFWDIISFVMNGIVFFFAGVASVNFLLRSSGVIFTLGLWPMVQFFSLLPLIYIAILLVRIIGMTLVNPLLSAMGSPLTMKNIVFSTASGLRGALCLILVQNLIQSNIKLGDVDKQILVVRGEMALWASGFVLMTLLVNAPLLGPLLKYLKLTEISPARKLMRAKAKRALQRFTRTAMDELRDDNDEMLRGTDWDMVEEYVTGEEADQAISSDGGDMAAAEMTSGLGFLRNGLNRMHSREVTQGNQSISRDLNKPLLETMDENNSDTDDASLATIHTTAGGSMRSAMPTGQLVNEEETIDDSDAVFHDFRRTGKMQNTRGSQEYSEPDADTETQSPFLVNSATNDSPAGGMSLRRHTVGMFGSSLSSQIPNLHDEADINASTYCDVSITDNIQSVQEEAADDEGDASSPNSMIADVPSRSLLVKTNSFVARRNSVKFDLNEIDLNASSPSANTAGSTTPDSPARSFSQTTTSAMSNQMSKFMKNSSYSGSIWQPDTGDVTGDVEAPPPSAVIQDGSASVAVSFSPPQESCDDARFMNTTPIARPRSAGDILNQGSTPQVQPCHSTLDGDEAPIVEEIGEINNEEKMSEARIRLIVGLKRYFQGKRTEGLLSAHGLRILNESADLFLDRPHQKLAMWKIAEKEACGKFVTHLMSVISFKMRTFPMWKCKIPVIHDWVHRTFLVPVIKLLNWRMSYTMTLACEVSIEYWLSLRHSPNAAWLSASAPELLEEIEEEMDRAWQFIVDREIEAPERFKMVQSYRAAMAVMRQQEFFLNKLYKSGLLDESEMHHLEDEISKRQNKLQEQGPGWKQPALNQIIRGLPFFRNISEDAYQWIKRHSFLMRFEEGTIVIDQKNSGTGMYVVVTGLVESKYKQVLQSFNNIWMVGTGGVVGLVAALTKSKVPGAADVVARGNPLGKGPVLMHIPQDVVDEIRNRATNGSRQFKQLEINLFRLAALNIVERLRPLLVEQICQNMVKNEKQKAASMDSRSKSRWAKIKKKVLVTDKHLDTDAFHATIGTLAIQKKLKTAAQLQSAAHRMLDNITLEFQDGYLLDLKPGALFVLEHTCVLVGGDLQGPMSIKNAKAPLGVVRGPYMFIRNEETAEKPKKYLVGQAGAAIVVAGAAEDVSSSAQQPSRAPPTRMASSTNLKSIVAPH